MPPKVEATLLVLTLMGAWVALENSHRIDLTRPDEEVGRWTTVASCQPIEARAVAERAAAANIDVADVPPGTDACGRAGTTGPSH